jgi:hypothetical protein
MSSASCSPSKICRAWCSMPFTTSVVQERSLQSRVRSGSGMSRSSGQAATCSIHGSTTSGGRHNTSGMRGSSRQRLAVQLRAGRCPSESWSYAHFSCRTMVSIAMATAVGSSCSQTRRTRQPWSTSSVVVCSSRSTFAASFAAHHVELFFAGTACSGQRCQKQPSTKTATCRFGKAMSIVRRGLPGTLTPTRNLRPLRCSSRRRSNSGAVSERLCELIRRRTSSVGGDERDSSIATPSNYDSGQCGAPTYRSPTGRLIVSVVPVLDAVTNQMVRGCGGSREPSQPLETLDVGDNSEH